MIDESTTRAKRAPWRKNERTSVAGCEAFHCLPIIDLSTDDAFCVIHGAGQTQHWISVICRDALLLPDLIDARQFAASDGPPFGAVRALRADRSTHRLHLSPSGIALPELRGVFLADNHDDMTGRTLSAGADVSSSVLRDRCLPCQGTLAFPIPTRPGTSYRNQLNYGVLRYAS